MNLADLFSKKRPIPDSSEEGRLIVSACPVYMQSIISMDKNTRRLMNFPGSAETSSNEICTNSRARFPIVKRKNNAASLRRAISMYIKKN